MNIELLHCYISPGHNYVGHHGRAPGAYPIIETNDLLCLAGRGIRGDRYLDHKENYKGQITFFAEETHRALCERLDRHDRAPWVYRRNVITRGVDLNELIGCQFEVQGVRFLGVEACKPCYWMDLAFGPGAEAALQGRGGLRARILTTGTLRRTSEPVPLRVLAGQSLTHEVAAV